jgi:hypothetical protein
MKNIKTLVAAIISIGMIDPLFAQDVDLHINTHWEECSFQLDPSLSQESWHQFTGEAARVVYFRPLSGAEPMGPGRFELSILQWNTGIDETESAWNETFVHPDSTHYLIGGDELPIPGLTLRAGITEKMDAGVFWTTSPGANYSIFGAQVQYNILNDTAKHWAVATRANYSMIYGPEDIGFSAVGIDVLASKQIPLFREAIAITPYALASADLAHAHERSDVVDLKDENVIGAQASLGVEAKIYCVRLGVEYNMSVVHTLSYKLGVQVAF